MFFVDFFLIYPVLFVGLAIFLRNFYRSFYFRKLASSYFQDKTVLVTGASSGLGKTLAEELYFLGAQVIMCARNVEEMERIRLDLMKRKSGKEPEVFGLDIGCKLEVMAPKITSLLSKYKRIDILINNAGVSYRGESILSNDDVYEKILSINFFGPVRLTNIIVNRMIEETDQAKRENVLARTYSIVNIGSIQSYIGIPYRAPYCASKHALQAYSDSLRAELFAYNNINVSTVNPGYIDTNVSINALTPDGKSNNINDDMHRKGFSTLYVSWKIINAILGKEKEVVVSVLLLRIGIWIRFFWPNFFFWMMNKRAEKMSKNKNNYQD